LSARYRTCVQIESHMRVLFTLAAVVMRSSFCPESWLARAIVPLNFADGHLDIAKLEAGRRSLWCNEGRDRNHSSDHCGYCGKVAKDILHSVHCGMHGECLCLCVAGELLMYWGAVVGAAFSEVSKLRNRWPQSGAQTQVRQAPSTTNQFNIFIFSIQFVY
jgi:hypothetical protein